MRKNRSAARRLRTPVFLILIAALLMLQFLAGCRNPLAEVPTPSETAAPTSVPTEPSQPTQPVAIETEPAVSTVPPDGSPDDVTVLGSYTVSDNEAIVAAHGIVASIGENQLTNADLQIFYWMAVNTYRDAAHELEPDFSQPLDAQTCPLSESPMTWQQYFLQQALDTWHSLQSLVSMSENYNSPTEEAYKPDKKKHEENLKEEIYNLDVLYGYNSKYKIADDHQAYLDELPTMLDQLAKERGFDSLSSLVKELAGPGTSTDYMLHYAELLNKGYMFATTLSYYIEPSEKDITAYFHAHEDAYTQAGITKDSGKYVNIRQILVVPKNGTKAADGTVTYSDSEWNTCQSAANSLLGKWKRNATEANFAELAFANSADTGSNGSGGLYSGIRQGQLTGEMDQWCFDPARKTGDTAVFKTASGYHILYFSGSTDIWYDQAQKDLKASLLCAQMESAREAYPMTVNYSAVHLALAQGDSLPIRVDEILFPDIAHQRFPSAPLYFQQDYPDTMYGKYPLRTYGCGVTTMAMLTSYMTDEEWTPPEMCALYGKYCSDSGTAHTMFSEVPTDRGFYLIEKTQSYDTVQKALENGYMVVTLQRYGFWTRGGHYLLLHNLIETKDGLKLQVRDSNLFNYKKLEGHITGYFDLETIAPNARLYWIYQKKVVRVDSCTRCGQPTEESVVPSAMFNTGYLCPKCVTATNRRDAYLNFCFGIKS